MSVTRRILQLSIPLALVASAAAQDAVVPVDFPTIQAAVNGATDTNGDGLQDHITLPTVHGEAVIDIPAGGLQAANPFEGTRISLKLNVCGSPSAAR